MGTNYIPPFKISKDQPLDILGRGIKFPYEAEVSNNSYNGVAEAEGILKIRQSMAQIFGTPIGSRYFNRLFGSNLYLLKFEPNDEIFTNLATYFIADALHKWEKRITLDSVAFQMSGYMIDNYFAYITTYFTIIRTQIQGNFVYPYYRGIPSVSGG
jgi:phage baseplate assembly protein W